MANQQPYPGMPQNATMQPFMPGFKEQIAAQLQKGFGSGADQYLSAMSGSYKPMNLMQLKEPLTQTLASFGMKPDDKGGWQGTPAGFMQTGQATGNTWLDQLLKLTQPQPVIDPPIGQTPITPTPPPQPPAPQTGMPSQYWQGYGRDR